MVIPYSLIFLTAIVGNALVVLTISLNRRMRTKTNAFLLNLAISNFLLGVFCMPFTLIGLLMKEFIFGAFLCSSIPYLQVCYVIAFIFCYSCIRLRQLMDTGFRVSRKILRHLSPV
ncbi:gastrin/cholecystokinin type B receptor-like protein [Leptotrombidium deliense]|uniref:Gastrin/cholecystokinin type B receptor-like protein n=1 Tax=Leptotrombidium deliense TaxID=299467 RepID=A0A443Q7V2_9ACAR|nr:gastrin/cholecystokinin type B receptor-like protein [Leptotrombidium deliense]